MTINYTERLRNLRNRRYDNDLQKAILSESFGKSVIPENLEYLVESMSPIGSTYNQKTIEAANRVQTHLERDLNVHFRRDYRTQGSVKTDTNIRLHSDIDLLTIINRYHFLAPALLPSPNPYNETSPEDDIILLRKQSTEILQRQYDEVDTTGRKNISIINKSLGRKVDIVFSFWYHTEDFEAKKEEYYRGVYLFNFPQKQKQLDFPFAHISNVNYKGESTKDGSKRGIRLLKTLKADANDRINLSSFHLTSLVHSIENLKLFYTRGSELQIAVAISDQLTRIINEPLFRKAIKSPNGTEHPLEDDNLVASFSELKTDLDQLIMDCQKEMYSNVIQKALITY